MNAAPDTSGALSPRGGSSRTWQRAIRDLWNRDVAGATPEQLRARGIVLAIDMDDPGRVCLDAPANQPGLRLLATFSGADDWTPLDPSFDEVAPRTSDAPLPWRAIPEGGRLVGSLEFYRARDRA